MKIKRVFCVVLVLAMVFAVAPVTAYAADIPLVVMPTTINTLKVGEVVDIVCFPIETGYDFSFAAYTGAVSVTQDNTNQNAAKIKALKSGVDYVYITVNDSAGNKGTKLLTINVGGSGSSALGPNEKKLTITSTTVLDKKIGDPAFTFAVSFNIPKKEVEYAFSIDNEDVATIDEDSGFVRIRSVGSAVITVSATAPGYTDSSGNSYADATKDFTLYVDDASAAGSTGSGSLGELTLSGGMESAGAAAPVTAPATTVAQLIAGDARYSNFELKGNVTIDGMTFRLSRNFSAGNAFAIVPDKPDGDWWKTPNSFTGSRGIYAAISPGVAPLIYADTTGKQYIININSYKTTKALSFTIPERIPVGALFGIIPPVSTTGRWFKDPTFLSGNSGTYIPLKTGSTRVTFESEGKRYHIILDIVPDSDAVAVDDTANTEERGAATGAPPAVEPIILN